MLPPRLRKFSETVRILRSWSRWLLTCLLPLARTVNLYKMKDFVGGLLGKERTQAHSYYKRLIRFFQDWGDNEAFFQDLGRQNLRFLSRLGFKILVIERYDFDNRKKLEPEINVLISYPPLARENGTQGTVVIQYQLNTDCSTTDIKVGQSVSKACDDEVIRFLQKYNRYRKEYGPAIECAVGTVTYRTVSRLE